jgi:Flp pilus assembly protein TadD
MTVAAQHRVGAMDSLERIPFGLRLANAVVSYARYLRKTVWPMDLAIYYPFPLEGLPLGLVVGSALLLAVITGLVLAGARRFPYVAVGWLWFTITLAPVSGILQAGPQAMADRFAYLPNIGLYLALAWGLRDLLAWRPAGRPVIVTAVVAALVGCLVLTRAQVSRWQDSVTIWRHTIGVVRDDPTIRLNLGFSLLEKAAKVGTDEEVEPYWQEAMAQFREALQIRPGMPPAHYNLGEGYFQRAQVELGRGEFRKDHFDEAAAHYRAALAGDPRMGEAHNRLGMIALLWGRNDEAVREFQQALEVKPRLSDAHANLAMVYYHQGKIDEAVDHARKALEEKADHAKAMNVLALWHLRQGRPDDAARLLEESLRIKPDVADINNKLAIVLGRQGKWAQAIERHWQAAQLAPSSAAYRCDIAYALNQLGRKTEARAEYKLAFELDPQWPKTTNEDAWRKATDPNDGLRDGAEAVRLAREVCEAVDPPQPEYLKTLAAALAENQQYGEAAAKAREALALARTAGQADLARQLEEQLHLYQQGKPYRTLSESKP